MDIIAANFLLNFWCCYDSCWRSNSVFIVTHLSWYWLAEETHTHYSTIIIQCSPSNTVILPTVVEICFQSVICSSHSIYCCLYFNMEINIDSTMKKISRVYRKFLHCISKVVLGINSLYNEANSCLPPNNGY